MRHRRGTQLGDTRAWSADHIETRPTLGPHDRRRRRSAFQEQPAHRHSPQRP